MLISLIAVASGGAVGSILRYLLVLIFTASALPMATMLVNVIGSFIIGIVSVLLPSNPAGNESLRLFIQIGLLGGFTTYSTYSLETVHLLLHGKVVTALVYMSATLVLCLICVVLGMQFAKLVQQLT